jgi:hypothetical protein
LLEDFSSSKAALLTNAVSDQALAGDQFIAQRKKRIAPAETRVSVDAVTALCDV